MSGRTRCARKPPIWSVSPAEAGVWHSALQIRPRFRGAGYRYGLRRSSAHPPGDRAGERNAGVPAPDLNPNGLAGPSDGGIGAAMSARRHGLVFFPAASTIFPVMVVLAHNRAADDFEAIRARMEELRRERAEAVRGEPIGSLQPSSPSPPRRRRRSRFRRCQYGLINLLYPARVK